MDISLGSLGMDSYNSSLLNVFSCGTKGSIPGRRPAQVIFEIDYNTAKSVMHVKQPQIKEIYEARKRHQIYEKNRMVQVNS